MVPPKELGKGVAYESRKAFESGLEQDYVVHMLFSKEVRVGLHAKETRLEALLRD